MATAKRLRIKYQNNKITRDILRSLLVGGCFILAAQSPYFLLNLIKHFYHQGWPTKTRKDKKRIYNTFAYLKRRGLIKIENRNRLQKK